MQNDDLEQALSSLKLKEPDNHYFHHGQALIQQQLKASRHIRWSRRLNVALSLTLLVSLSLNLFQQFEAQVAGAERFPQVCSPESGGQSTAAQSTPVTHEAPSPDSPANLVPAQPRPPVSHHYC